jgi:hypothetical protein
MTTLAGASKITLLLDKKEEAVGKELYGSL